MLEKVTICAMKVSYKNFNPGTKKLLVLCLHKAHGNRAAQPRWVIHYAIA